MTVREVFVAGTRTFSAEVVGYAEDAGLRVAGLLEPSDRANVGATIHDLPVQWLDETPGEGRSVLVGTGDADRRRIVERLVGGDWVPATLVHPRAHVARSASVGTGSLVAPGVVVGAFARIGDHVVVGRGSLVGHHTEIGAFATLGPGANVAGNVRLGKSALVAMGAVVRDHVAIGEAAVVGMGAVVVHDVPAGALVRGVPAIRYEE